MEYLIGEFSLVARLSVKTLRFYHEEGILLPTRIDPITGYRYYDEAGADRAMAIRELRALGFSLEAIKEIFSLCEEDEDIVPFLERRGKEIARKIEEFRSMEGMIEEFLERQKEMKTMNVDKNIVIKELPDLTVAGIRFKGKYDQVGRYFGPLMKRAGKYAMGGPMTVYHDHEYRDEDADIEVCVPVRKAVNEGDVSSHLLAGGRAVTLIHQGPYDTISDSYRKIGEYMKECGLKPGVPSRELYLKGPGMIFAGNPRKYLTEIQVIAAK
ncbi:MAG: MerR family transcriptional regulator [Spirochaetaceae bacterium]|nr:MerR family transcriptional regulator [Spirochaetaceae bacterium]